MRIRGQSGIARILYIHSDQQIVVVRAFTKKTQRTPKHEIQLALQRAKEII